MATPGVQVPDSALAGHIDLAMVRDRRDLRAQWRRVQQRVQRRQSFDRALEKFTEDLQQSLARATRRGQHGLRLQYPEELPISARADEIVELLQRHQVLVLAGETGSGKTTQIPKMCLQAGRGRFGLIGHTQPRRLAARTVAARIAEELGVELGSTVGFQVRFTDVASDDTLIKQMTDGILLAEIPRDPLLTRYDTIIIDEAHERSLNIDFLLGYLARILPQRPDLKLIVTSATIDTDKFSRHFSNAPVVEVSGRTYPVDILYRPLTEEDDPDLNQAIVNAVQELVQLEKARRQTGPRDVLVFLPGEREIREAAEVLRRAQLRDTEILPLYARLSLAEQQRVFAPHRGRRIVLATNVAETSLTVPGIRYVVDPGLARISRYSVRSKVQRLPVEAVSQASANQRMGRCGRIADGVCIRLFAEDDFNSRPEFTEPELLRTNLASVILSMRDLGIGDIEDFPFVDPPEQRQISDGIGLLQELSALNSDGSLSTVGRALARLPVDPRLGRVLLVAQQRGCLYEAMIVCSALSVQDPRERPAAVRAQADEVHAEHAHERSDFYTWVHLWRRFEEQRQALTQRRLRDYCHKHFLSYMRMREWRDVHRQLRLECRALKLTENTEPCDYDSLHQALLSGFLTHIGQREEGARYRGTRDRVFHIFPGSAQHGRPPGWLMASELTETTRLYARNVAAIRPEWIEPLAPDLVKRNYSEPHWNRKQGRVMVFEQVSLLGLVLVARRPVNYAPIDPAESRRVFIEHALAGDSLGVTMDFLEANRALIQDAEGLEAKVRRRDILVDGRALAQFYDERLPQDVHDRRSLQRWLKHATSSERGSLFMTADFVRRRESASGREFPDVLELDGASYRLSYEFSPDKDSDGVTAHIPLPQLHQLPGYPLQWLVPGMLREKCIALIRTLPKASRRQFVPAADVVARIWDELQAMDHQQSLHEALARCLSRDAGVRLEAASFRPDLLDDFHRMNLRVTGDKGETLAQGRDLPALQQQLSAAVTTELAAEDDARGGLTRWQDVGELPRQRQLKRGGQVSTVYPALVDEGESVALVLRPRLDLAEHDSRQGILRLVRLAEAQSVRYCKRIRHRHDPAMMLYSGHSDENSLFEDLLWSCLDTAYLAGQPLPRDEAQFQACLKRGRAELVPVFERASTDLRQVFVSLAELRTELRRSNPVREPALLDVRRHLSRLIYAGFLRHTRVSRLTDIDRYVRASIHRLQRLQGRLAADQEQAEALDQWWQRYEQIRQDHAARQLIDPAVDEFRWLLEEYRLSLFAQQLRTSQSVSAKRLQKAWQALQSH